MRTSGITFEAEPVSTHHFKLTTKKENMKTKLIFAGLMALGIAGANAQNASYNQNNIAIGGTDNSAFGFNTLNNGGNPGTGNAAFGKNVMSLNNFVFANYNSGFGMNSLAGNITGYYNSGCGASAIGTNSAGVQNSAIGTLA